VTGARRTLIEPSKRLPELRLPSLPDGAPLRLRASARRSPLLLLVDDVDCAECAALVRRLEAEAEALRDWDARVLIVVPEPLAEAGRFPSAGIFPVLSDAESRLATALSVRAPALVIADQWGEVYVREEAGEGHAFLALPDILDWLRYLDIQCPECQGEAF
jgi:hypothetical protein